MARGHPHKRRRPEFGERAGGPGVRVEQAVDIGIVEPEVGQGFQRLAGFDRLREENAVDAACTGAGDDVGHDAQADAALRLDRAEQRAQQVCGGDTAARQNRFAHRLAGQPLARLQAVPEQRGDLGHAMLFLTALVLGQRQATLIDIARRAQIGRERVEIVEGDVAGDIDAVG